MRQGHSHRLVLVKHTLVLMIVGPEPELAIHSRRTNGLDFPRSADTSDPHDEACSKVSGADPALTQ